MSSRQEIIEGKVVDTATSGWMTLHEIANVESIPWDGKDEATRDTLMDLVDDVESKPHNNAKLAAKGHKLYFYVKTKATEHTQARLALVSGWWLSNCRQTRLLI